MATRKSKLIVVAGVALGLVALGAATASAAPTTLWTVSAGSDHAGAKPEFAGISTGAIALIDLTTGQAIGCGSGSTKVDVTAVGTGLPGNDIAKISGSQTTWNSCSGPGGLPFEVGSDRFWQVNALMYNKAGGVTSGNVNNVHVGAFSPASGCEVQVKGSLGFQYTNSTQVFDLYSTKSPLSVTYADCFGAISVGDAVILVAHYQLAALNPKNTPLDITRP